ncbi:MAG: hypothetical protein IJZ29_02895 [Clostridia bacterium]|nr:hypothetical protein [Clostridia bacterium]
MKILDEKSFNYTKKLILNGYVLKAVNSQNSLVYMNQVADMKIVFNNNLKTNKAKECVDKLQVMAGKVTENQLKDEVVKLVDLGCITEKTAVGEFGKYLNNEKNKEIGRQA